MLVVLVGGMGVVEGPDRVPDAITLYQRHDRVLDRMGAGPLNDNLHVARDTATASPILNHGPDDPKPRGA